MYHGQWTGHITITIYTFKIPNDVARLCIDKHCDHAVLFSLDLIHLHFSDPPQGLHIVIFVSTVNNC